MSDQLIINTELEPWTVTVPLALSAHSQAERFRRCQSTPHKAKQVYLNTLAVYAVDVYLQCRGFDTDLEKSVSWNPMTQMLMDVADLVVKNRGKLECRPVLPNAATVYVPAEAWEDRLGCVAVHLNESLREATLLGFVEKVARSELPLSQLRSLRELPGYLNQVRPLVNLSQWFEECFEIGWQSLEALLGTNQANLAFSLRSATQLNATSVKRAKLIDLGLQLGRQSVALLVTITPEEQKVGISVRVHPVAGETYLPPHLKLSLLSELGENLQEVQSRNKDNYIQLKRFRGSPGECFNILVTVGDISVTEAFII